MNPVHTTPRRYDTIGLHLPSLFFPLKDIMISPGIRVGMASKDLNKGYSLRTVKMGDAPETKRYSPDTSTGTRNHDASTGATSVCTNATTENDCATTATSPSVKPAAQCTELSKKKRQE